MVGAGAGSVFHPLLLPSFSGQTAFSVSPSLAATVVPAGIIGGRRSGSFGCARGIARGRGRRSPACSAAMSGRRHTSAWHSGVYPC